MSDITTLRDALQELVDRDWRVVDRTIEIRFASHGQALRALRGAREAYRAVDAAGSEVNPVAWMDPDSRDVISAERKAFWASRLGEGGANQAASYSVPLIEFRPTLDRAAAEKGEQ